MLRTMAEKRTTDGAAPSPPPTPDQEVRRLYEEAESRLAKAAERVVSRDSFGELLAMMTENVVALTRIGNEAMDLVLQEVEKLRDELGRSPDGRGHGSAAQGAGGGAAPSGREASGGGASAS